MRHVMLFEEFINEDWFDEYMEYVSKVFKELRNRMDISQRDEDDLSTHFGGELEKGWKKNIAPKKLALQLIPRGQTYKLTRWG